MKALFATLSLLALAPVTLASSITDDAAWNVVDRSFSCVVQVEAGLRRVSATANSGFRDPQTGRWRWPAYAGLGGRAVVAYGFVTAGGPAAPTESAALVYPKAIGVDAGTCDRTTRRIPFTHQGLAGGLAGRLQGVDTFECSVPARLLVRIRARFATPVRIVQREFFSRRWYTTEDMAPARRAELAIATAAGKPLVYAEVRATGDARMFTAKGCTPG